MKLLGLLCAIVVALAIPVAASAATVLVGTSSLHVLQKVEYRASGLKPQGRYSLRIRRNVAHDGRTYRCVAFLSAPRTASGTERFKGSVPDGLQCVPTRGSGATWQPRTSKGTYQAVVCVAAARNLCTPGYSVATKTVRIR
jgi:hypothetical protein